jgi:predicted amidohydrolase YtcJ
VGSDDEISTWIDARTEVVELGGRTVTPGLVDARCHVAGLGADLERISVRGIASEAGFTRGAAFAEGAEKRRGMIALGRDADLTVFDRTLTADVHLLATRIRMTIVEGRVAYRGSASP